MRRELQAFSAGLLVALCVTVYAARIFAYVQNPTMNEHRPPPPTPAPQRTTPRPPSTDIQRDVSGLLDSVDRIEAAALLVNERQVELRVEQAVMSSQLETLSSYAAWAAAALTAAAIGVGLHLVTTRRKARGA